MSRLFLLALLAAPSVLRAQAPNDLCSNALPLACGQALTGTTLNATSDAAPACGTAISAPGVWYTIIGNGQQITLSTCPDEEYDTKLNVYEGSCGALVCVGGNDDAAAGVYCSTVSFASQVGTAYLVLVQGYDGESGPFTLTATCQGLSNDVCAGALPITCGQTYSGTTANATSDAAPFCETGVTAPGVWHDFVGTGQQVIISTCPDEAYDTKLNVYTGSCNALSCLNGNDDAADGAFCSTVTFVAELGVTYHVLVQGYDGETGPFELSVQCLACGAPLNVSALATDVTATIGWTSTNTGSVFVIEYGPAGFVPGTGTTVIGTVGVDGPPVMLTGLDPATEYEVYALETCGGEESPWAGPVLFTTLTEPPAANAWCSGTLPITCGGEVFGNTASGMVASAPSCASANITSRGLWYSFVGNGDDATVSTCVNSTYDTKISVFTGGCGALSCAAGNDDGPNCPGNTSETTIQTTPGTTYLVLVHGYGAAEGEFALRLTCTPACTTVENDTCSNATPLTVQPTAGCESSTGTTACAFSSPEPNPPCDPYANIVDTWYSFNTGWSSDLQLIIEPGSASVVHAALYTACGAPEYIECWTEVNGPIDLVGLPQNTDLLVRVWNGGGAETGTFSICVEGSLNVRVTEPAPAVNRIWPVPADDALFIEGAPVQAPFLVVDAQGRTVLQGATSPARPASIAVGRLEAGTYLLLIDGFPAGRFVKR